MYVRTEKRVGATGQEREREREKERDFFLGGP